MDASRCQAGQRRRRCPPGASAPSRFISTASCAGWPSTGACSRRPATPAHPLLERLRFLSISGNNLDEFFMVRVAGLKAQQLLGVEEPSADGLTPAQQLAAIAAEADALTASQQGVWADLRELLREAGVAVLGSGRDRRGGSTPGSTAISTIISSRC